MNNPNYKGIELLPLSVIEAARAGDAEAVERVLQYYSGYMNKLAVHPDALRRKRLSSCVSGRGHETPSGNQAHPRYRHDEVTNRPPEAETA